MTDGLRRYCFPGSLHFVTFSCYRLRPYLGSASARNLFEEALEKTRQNYHFEIHGYVVMPEHVHLLIAEPARTMLPTALQALKVSVSKRSPQRPFWQARYYDFNVFTAKKLVEKLRYIHRNPTKRSLVQRPEDWLWSSFAHYATGKRGVVEIESPWTKELREGGRKRTEAAEAIKGQNNKRPDIPP